MRIYLQWLNPAPIPACGFKALYRRKGDSEYSSVDTSGSTTSGSTAISIPISAPTSYEGIIKSDCCGDTLSAGDPWGVNAYNPLSLTIINRPASPLKFLATITSTYSNPYDTLITGTFTGTFGAVPIIYPYSITYPAGSTTAEVLLPDTVRGLSEIVTNVVISAISAVFANGGDLQQYDAVSTPQYFRFYSSGSTATSGSTMPVFLGAPDTLPSFTIDEFQITEVDGSDVTQAGDLLISWIQETLYNNGDNPYNIFTIEVTDPASVVAGAVTINAGPKGLRSVTIPLTKTTNYLLDDTTTFTMKIYRADDVLITGSSKDFYFPG